MVDNNQENARVGYQVAVNLWGTIVETSWSRFNAMVVANSIIIGILGLILSNEKINLYVFVIVVSLIGFILCVLWYFLMR